MRGVFAPRFFALCMRKAVPRFFTLFLCSEIFSLTILFFLFTMQSMKKHPMSRSFLETLAFDDLAALADNYGIDIPDNFNRAFLIEDLLDGADAKNAYRRKNSCEDFHIPENYNTTEIGCILRNPRWLFVYWNISEFDKARIEENFSELLLSVVSTVGNKTESYDTAVRLSDSSEYLMCPKKSDFVSVDLVEKRGDEKTTLASAMRITVPQSNKISSDFYPGTNKKISAASELSGFKSILRELYENHRESFA